MENEMGSMPVGSGFAHPVRRRSRLLAAVLLALGGGCTGEADAPEDVVRLELQSFVAGPGTEGLKCQTFANPSGETVEIAEWSSHLSQVGHHALVFLVEEGASDSPLQDCGGSDGFRPILFQGQAAGDRTMTYPSGVTALLPADAAILVQIHYLNSSSEDVTVRTAIDLRRAPPGTVSEHVAPVRLENRDIHVLPGDTGTISRSCAVDRDVAIVWLTSHMHARGVEFRATIGDDVLYETRAWDDPPVGIFETPRAISAGQAVSFSCTYDNDTDHEITFGTSLEADAMCVLVGAYVPSDGGDATLSCTDEERTCLPCIDALIERAPERLCTDDGTPSSKDQYDALWACTCETTQGCVAECGDSACSNLPPSDPCFDCLDTKCGAETDVCFAG